MGRPPKNPPKERELKALIEDLGEAGCMMMWKGRTPFFRSGAGHKTAELWQVWAGAVDSTPRSRWLNFNSETTRYPGSIEDTEVKMLAILSGDRSAGLIAGDPGEIIHETHGDDKGLTRQEAAKRIYEHWCNEHTALLQDALTELKRVRNERKQLYGIDVDTAAKWLSQISDSLPDNASVLQIDHTKQRISDPEVRRRLFMRPVLWSNVCRGGYAERPLLRHKLLQDFEGFLAGSEDCIASLQIPVFWIGGRSGDGKSVLLMQLCHLVKQAHPSLPIIHFHEPDALIDWIETSAHEQEVFAARPLILSVVDDLHKATDWDRAQNVLEKAATVGASFAIITCGPNPERSLFAEQPLIQSCLALQKCDSTKLTPQDVDAIAEHLGVEIDADEGTKATLVERVFLTLAGQASIDNFARSLRDRFDARVGRGDLLKQLTAMAWLDLPLPRELASYDEAEWLEVLAGESQLHISVGGGGFYFGHPAIARPIFDALTKAESLSLTTRIAQTLSETLNNLKSPLDTNRTLRQTVTRLTTDAEVDVIQVLNHLCANTNSARVKSAVIVFLIYYLTRNNLVIQGDWLRLARTYRANISLEPQTRAFLARNLAFAKSAEESDLRAAFNLVSDPNAGPYMGRFLEGLTSKSNRALGWTFKGLLPALNWVQRNVERPDSQDVLVAYLSHYPNDTRVRDAAIAVVNLNSKRKTLSSKTMAAIAKYMEDEFEAELLAWLVTFCGRPISTDVFTALLKKPGNKWDDLVHQHLDAALGGDPAWLSSLARLVPHINSKDMTEAVQRVARDNLQAPGGDPNVGGLYTTIAERASFLGAEDLVCERLSFLWQPQSLAEYGVDRQACLLLGKAWGQLADRHDSFRDWGQELFNRLSEIECEAKRQQLSSARKKHRNGLRGAAAMILNANEHTGLCARPALTFYDAFPDDELSGIAVAKLLLLLCAETSEGLDPETLSELRRREEELVAACWTWSQSTTLLSKDVHVHCTYALLKARWDSDTEKVRELVRSFWQPELQYGADRVLQSYLRDPRSAGEAWELLLDRSIDRERHNNVRARVVARNLEKTFERLEQGNLSHPASNYLLQLLERGIGDHQTNASAAWAALQRREIWPAQAETALWRGILRSALEGFTLREQDYRPSFNAWQAINQDPRCSEIIARAKSYVATE